jgi:hypothetical protein
LASGTKSAMLLFERAFDAKRIVEEKPKEPEKK